MPVKRNYRGRKFGSITLLAPVPRKPGYWTGTCSCGNAVEKRIDNLNRPGNHSCGECYLATLATNATLEERVRRLELILAKLDTDATKESPLPERVRSLLAAFTSEGRAETAAPMLRPKHSLFSNVTHIP